MAIATWCTVSPKNGTGDGSVSVSASAHTGRSQRSTSLTFNVDGLDPQTVAVSQAAKAEFVTISNTAVSATKDGGEVTINGTTNSTKLTFSLGSGDISLTLPTNYTANSVSTANGAAITGDPGAAAQFSFSIKLTVPKNETISQKTRVITATTAGNQTANATITQAKGDPTLTVTPTTIALVNAGTAQSVTVKSNAPWTVS